MYGETLISNDDLLSLFLRSPDIFRNHISITTLDTYAVVERSPVISEINDNDNATKTMIGFGRPQNGISNTGIESTLWVKCLTITMTGICAIVRCNDAVEILTQLAEIINNNDLVIVQQDISDSDTHSDHCLIEDDHLFDNEDVVNMEGEDHGDQNINYHSIAIPYLVSTEESVEDFARMRDNGPVRTAF
ncbi:hypothetical protein HAX54_051836 [Datura stramonium]|uniref:Uncharacterized protein n=1 Tax=Datura stramonium TaxID=4076 RepID=A0ABS8SYS8_DATST|nr:hypothetical protein [Datura stramonium]